MHTVERYEVAKQFAKMLGYDVREENLCGRGGGACEVAGQKCLFVDLTLSADQQLEMMLVELGADPLALARTIPEELLDVWPRRRAAA